MNAVMVMSFDGDHKLERPLFKTIDDAWEYSADLGSKWFFYPFHFVVSESGKTIKDAAYPLEYLIGKRVKTVKRLFAETAKDPENEGLEPFEYSFALLDC